MSVGAQLRASREARGLSLDAVSQKTRVQPRILAAIERDDVASVPPRPFGRGFVRSYAEQMGLDPEQTARDYFAQFAPAVTSPRGERTSSLPSPPRQAWPLWSVVLAGVAVGVGIAFFLGRPGVRRRTPRARQQQP